MRVFIWFLLSFIFVGIGLPVCSQCLKDQQSLLLKFKSNHFPTEIAEAEKWNQSVDCCFWDGIKCDKNGHVTGLDLNNQSLTGAINDSSSLFGLAFLQSINLAYNDFEPGLLTSGFGKLTLVTYLNLSNANFEGQIPIELSLMTKLVTLDLTSDLTYQLIIQTPDLKMLVQNLTELRYLYLDNVNIMTHGYHWSTAISSSLPNLQVLSLKSCNLSGTLDSSLTELKHLSVIILDGNTFSSGIPKSFGDLQNLIVFSLQGCKLSGLLPYNIFQVPTLKTIDLSNNVMLEGRLPDSMGAFELENLDLSNTRVGGRLTDSIGSLKMLSRIILRACEFSGPIPDSMQNLTRLEDLDLSVNQFTGSIPSFKSSKNHLVSVNLYRNNLTSGIPTSHWEGLDKLEYLNLASNFFTGSFPESFLTLTSLRELYLSNNSFSGKIKESRNVSCYQLSTMDLSSNKFQGPFPGFIFKLAAISTLTLSANKFNGKVDLHMFAKLKELYALELSYNNLTISVEATDNSFSLLSRLSTLSLASCKMQEIPDLKNQSRLMSLDLSNNQLGGEIPNCN